MADKVSAKVVDFSNVKDGGGSFNKKRVPSGDYLATVTAVVDAPSKKDDVFQYLFTVKLEKYSQYAYPYYCKLQENQLWKLRNLLIAAGLNVPKKKIKLDPSKVIGKVIGVTMEDDEYDGKPQSTIAAVFPASELSDEDMDVTSDDEDEEYEEEETEDEADEDTEGDAEDEAEDEGDDFDGMDRAELKAWLVANVEGFQARKSQTDDDLRELARAANATDDEEEEEEEEEEPEPPKPAKKAAAKPAAKSKAKKAVEIDDDELEELDIDDL